MGVYNKVLIAGGAGFIGSNIINHFINDLQSITVIDNMSTGSMFNVEKYKHLSNYHFIMGDITRIDDLKKLSEEKFDLVVNLACPANPPYCFSHPLEIARTNVYGVFNLAEIAKKSNAVFFQASTSEVYGDPEISPQTEEYWGHVNPIGIRACYDEGKRCAESILYDYHRMYGLDVRICRIFNTYGPGMNLEDGRVMIQFVCNALKNEPLIIYGDGSQTRSFCYIDDLVNGVLGIIKLDKMPIKPINLGCGEEITILELAKTIIRMTDSKSTIVFESRTPDDPKKRRANCDYVAELLGWKPKMSLEEGLKKVIPYFSVLMGE